MLNIAVGVDFRLSDDEKERWLLGGSRRGLSWLAWWMEGDGGDGGDGGRWLMVVRLTEEVGVSWISEETEILQLPMRD